MDAALSNYEIDKFARSSAAARAAYETTWKEYHAKVQRLSPEHRDVPVFPLVPEMIARIAALMKLDGFRSFGNYLAWAKSVHISGGNPWTQFLDLEAKHGNRSVNRGLGVARQSASFDLVALAALGDNGPVCGAGSPLFPKELSIIGALWILREIEVAWASFKDVTINEDELTVNWFLPVSKVDTRAKACDRSWGCICDSYPPGVCPYHVMHKYRGNLLAYFEDKEHDVYEGPLFPDTEGKVIKKANIVAALEAVVCKTGERLTNSTGQRRYGGHSMRVTGSRWWAMAGLEVSKIQIFARWGSAVVLRYVSDVPITNLTGEVCGRPRMAQQCQLSSLKVRLDKHIQCAQDQISQLQAALDRLDSSVKPSYVQSVRKKRWHVVLTCGFDTPPSLWQACCGWKFGLTAYELSPSHPSAGSLVCDRTGCLSRFEQLEAGPLAEASGSASDNDSSASESG